MLFSRDREAALLQTEVHCPYCNTDHAVLLSKTTSKKISLQYPAYGLKFVFSLLYLSFIQIWVHGYKLLEAIKKIDSVTYAFCPGCGNSYSMAPPAEIQEETEEPKFCRVRDGKVIMGMCTGIAAYTGISLLWVRIMTVVYGLTGLGTILYFLIGACVPYQENLESGIQRGKLYRVRKGKDLTGLCKGFSEYTDIPATWIRLFVILTTPTILNPLLYFLLSAFIPVREDVEAGIIRKKLRKTHHKKVLFGLCAGLSERTGAPRWLFRILAILLFPLYLILSAIVPTKEEEDG